MDRTLTVGALTRQLQRTLADLGQLTVVGELAEIRVVASGHCYATLKEQDAVLAVVLWRSTVARHGPLPAAGLRVEARGVLDLYPPRGSYQLIATRLTPLGAGDLAARFERLKAQLLAEGLFAAERKIPLPRLPRAVGLATASGSAALADLIDSIRHRFPTMPIVLAPCRVQGPGAAAEVAAAIRRLDRHPLVDVIVVGRGGGSLEDLWAFNEEETVRAIATCETPIISAVGHETDTTLADLAADVRAKTPTAAGEMVVPDHAELVATLAAWRAELDDAVDAHLGAARERLARLASHRALARPGFTVQLYQQRLDELADNLRRRLTALAALAQVRLPALASRLERGADAVLRAAVDRLRHTAGRLHSLSPVAVLARGYAIITDATGRIVHRPADAPVGSRIQARLAEGQLDATVTGPPHR
jgi:exodeoxyribonuclease VII large subunit